MNPPPGDRTGKGGPENLPWTRRCFVCGDENPHGLRQRMRLEDGRVVMDYRPRHSDLGYRHIVHGGIGMTLLDEVMTWAAIIRTGGGCVAAEINVRLRRPMRLEQTFRVTGWIERDSSRLLIAAGRIEDEAGEVMMEASGKYMPMPAGESREAFGDFVRDPSSLDPDRILQRNA